MRRAKTNELKLIELKLKFPALKQTEPNRTEPNRTGTTTTTTTTALDSARRGQHFAPKLIHQPQSVLVGAEEPHTIECPIESEPEAQVSWFKGGRLLASEPLHFEQTGRELMFFQIKRSDSGQYYCLASNYLGSARSEPFELTVKPGATGKCIWPADRWAAANQSVLARQPPERASAGSRAGRAESKCKAGPMAAHSEPQRAGPFPVEWRPLAH